VSADAGEAAGENSPPPPPAEPEPEPSANIPAMLDFARQFIGTPYLLGGTTPEAFDCSGFVGHVFDHAGIDLPRTSGEQAKFGRRIPMDAAKKGDLVFFSHTGTSINHVGIIISDPGRPLAMIHASTSKGVIESDLASSTYWKPRITHVQRVIG
jgi:cell wall-associated NlpC family hydrolase